MVSSVNMGINPCMWAFNRLIANRPNNYYSDFLKKYVLKNFVWNFWNVEKLLVNYNQLNKCFDMFYYIKMRLAIVQMPFNANIISRESMEGDFYMLH